MANSKIQIPRNVQIPSKKRRPKQDQRRRKFQGSFKFQLGKKATTMTEENAKPQPLDERTFLFAQNVRQFVKKLPRTSGNNEDIGQLVRASGSVAGNYIEANESLSKKDFAMRMKICRKEAKESHLWLRLLDCGEQDELENTRRILVQEARELMLIFNSIITKGERR